MNQNRNIFIKLTEGCNKHCSFCISSTNNNPYNLSFTEFKILIDKIKKTRIILFGGEPTINKDFLKCIEYLVKIQPEISFSTNLLCDINLLKQTINLCKQYNKHAWILINGNELTDINKQIFINNLNYLNDIRIKKEIPLQISANFVLDITKPYEKNIQLIDEAYELYNSKIMLLSVLPRIGSSIHYVGDVEVGDKILQNLQYIKNKFGNKIGLSHDFYRCNFKSYKDFVKYKSYLTKPPKIFITGVCGSSLLMDNTYLYYCIYGDVNAKIDHTKYKYIEDSYNDLEKKYQEVKSQYKLSEICSTCTYECDKKLCSQIL